MPSPSAADSLNIVMAASEAVPYAKTGGLADVVGALPRYLIRLGHRVTLILPGYRSLVAGRGSRPPIAQHLIPAGGRSVTVMLEEERVPLEDGCDPLRVLVVRYDPYF
ncbi:MAG TPA: glycogen/starch synthase, partial [Nitrospira sp.]|nr:glycogen/starch synthase [Nitrospira sp.]